MGALSRAPTGLRPVADATSYCEGATPSRQPADAGATYGGISSAGSDYCELSLVRSGESRFSVVPRFLALLLTLLPAFAANPALDVHAIAQAVDNRYNHLRTLQAEFTETYRGAGIERTESGSLWLKKPGKMRWEYRSPKEKLFLSDGKDAWFYLPGDRQVRRTSVQEAGRFAIAPGLSSG